MRAPLPSLNALRAFETTVRHRSMTLAAAELHVTHGAISRHIRELEKTLGLALVTRTARSTEPTQEGQKLADGLTGAFGQIQTSIERIRAPGPLMLSCSSSIMMGFILPRIGQFQVRNPQIDLRFDMNYNKVDFARDEVGVAIRSSFIEPPPQAVVCELGKEAIGPVCSPRFLAQSGIARPQDVRESHLLATRTRLQAWADWRSSAGVDCEDMRGVSIFDHHYLLIQAAACGLGLATVPQMLVLDQLESGQLVAPFGFVIGPRRIMLWTAPHVAGRPDAVALEKWLTTEMGAIGAAA